MKKNHIAIIGAGLTGLLLAQKLKNFANITLFEKSRGVGGRLATRRNTSTTFDHGAQYFTARNTQFKAWLAPLINQNLVTQWHPKYALFDGFNLISTQWPSIEPRYIATPSMNTLAKYLASEYHILNNVHIDKIYRDTQWTLKDTHQNIYSNFDWIILAIPSHQALHFIDKNSFFYEDLAKIKMTPCFSAMLEFNHPLDSAFDCAHIKNHDIAWLALNHTKPGRSSAPTLIVQSSAKYSEQCIDMKKEDVLEDLIHKVTSFLPFNSDSIIHKDIHLWRYANNQDFSTSKLLVDCDTNLAIAGDFCSGGRVEGAFDSAMKTADIILNKLK
ncbi:NAD(P)/FAD-dependent oxidoreductase [Thorsellia kenyensis]|uniref:NAD(P)/FAD-dependent oxidoreductase n=1 Tax=Thorsellia kenyensis TaxID=1549888 RepID=A0ABV6C8B2_9GAMM